ncbi:MAG: SDR family oxidoreductase [Armatimonadetes bacterium]|nr:SDR family oxidoreductase [Armatimonadota bacterium]
MTGSGRRALVTGGGGFIGSHLTQALLAREWKVCVLDDLSTGLRENLREGPEFCFVQGSILDKPKVEAAMSGADAVFHLAAAVSVPLSVENPDESFAANASGTLNVLEAARKCGVKRFVYSSSAAVYGERPESPKTEDLAPMPVSPYAAGKLAGEHLVSAYAHSFGMEAVSLRYFNVFGPRQRPDTQYAAVVPAFISRLLAGRPLIVYGDGEQTRDFTYVENVVEANLLAAEASGVSGAVMNCASGQEVSVNRLIEELSQITGRRPEVTHEPRRAGDVRHSVASTKLAERILGFKPGVTWQEGLRLTVEAATAGQP